MRRSCLLASAVVLVLGHGWSASAGAQPLSVGQLDLAWDDCYNGGLGGGAQRSFACDSNDGEPIHLVLSVITPVGLTQFIGSAAVIDFASAQTTLPDWWSFGACRASSSLTAVPPAGETSCIDLVEHSQFGGIDYAMLSTIGAPHRARLRTAYAVDASLAGPVPGDVERALIRVTMNRARTIGAGACEGCPQPVCIAANSVLLDQSDPNLPDALITQGAQLFVLWQQAEKFDCLTSVRSSTWGQLKSLYR